jgi:UDP-3-O-[3-hydroxymyristoyl] glucosamine N-acyltransferase
VLLAHVVIYRGARIGDNFFAHAHAVVREGCQLGNSVLLQNGAVIGADGFGFAKDDSGHWYKILQPAPVIIEDDVKSRPIPAWTGPAWRRPGSGAAPRSTIWCRLDTVPASGAFAAGFTGGAGGLNRSGNHVILTGQVGVVGHCKIGDGAIVTTAERRGG